MWALLQVISIIGSVCGILYCCFCVLTAINFRSRKREDVGSNFTPPVSVLKPLCGVDPHAYESLRSHCVQHYSDFEIIFGVGNPHDPILPAVERLMGEFPNVSIRLAVCPKVSGMNFKVSNLLQMLPLARYEYVLINDSDICVPADYLRRVAGPLENASVGMVTCLYRGIAADTIGSRMESLGISSDFAPGVLCANQLESGMHFALGSTMAFRRRTLNAIGGLEALADYLADDYELGNRITKAGLRVELADCVVEHYLADYSLSAFFQHQMRWARTIRSSRPGGYAGLVFTFAIPWSVLATLASRGATWAWILLSTAVIFRLAVAFVFRIVVLRDRQVWRDLWLLPGRDCVALLIWVACYMGHQVVWRGKKFELANGKLRPA